MPGTVVTVSTSSSPDPGAAAGGSTALAKLLTPEGMRLLDSLGPYREDQALGTLTRLRAEGFDPELVSEALTQSRLRTAGAEKFGEFAARMLFTQAGLEQATRLPVSALHAARFRGAGIGSVADLGCGIGADSMAFAALGLRVVAVERDETTAAVATVNLMPFGNAGVVLGDVESLDRSALPGGEPESLWLDPARRHADGKQRSPGNRRIFDPQDFSPPLSFVEDLATTGVPMGVKLGPGLPHDAVPARCEAQWISHRGDIVEVVLWFNALACPGIRRAALILDDDGTRHELTSPHDFPDAEEPREEEEADAPFEPGPGDWLWEPDGAVIRAALVQVLGKRLGAQPIHPRIAYLVGSPAEGGPTSGPGAVQTPFARAYRIREVLPHTVKVLKAWVKEHRVGTLEIKKRGTDVTPEQLRKQLKPSGPNRATLIVTRVGGAKREKRVVLVVDPVKSTGVKATG